METSIQYAFEQTYNNITFINGPGPENINEHNTTEITDAINDTTNTENIINNTDTLDMQEIKAVGGTIQESAYTLDMQELKVFKYENNGADISSPHFTRLDNLSVENVSQLPDDTNVPTYSYSLNVSVTTDDTNVLDIPNVLDTTNISNYPDSLNVSVTTNDTDVLNTSNVLDTNNDIDTTNDIDVSNTLNDLDTNNDTDTTSDTNSIDNVDVSNTLNGLDTNNDTDTTSDTNSIDDSDNSDDYDDSEYSIDIIKHTVSKEPCKIIPCIKINNVLINLIVNNIILKIGNYLLRNNNNYLLNDYLIEKRARELLKLHFNDNIVETIDKFMIFLHNDSRIQKNIKKYKKIVYNSYNIDATTDLSLYIYKYMCDNIEYTYNKISKGWINIFDPFYTQNDVVSINDDLKHIIIIEIIKNIFEYLNNEYSPTIAFKFLSKYDCYINKANNNVIYKCNNRDENLISFGDKIMLLLILVFMLVIVIACNNNT